MILKLENVRVRTEDPYETEKLKALGYEEMKEEPKEQKSNTKTTKTAEKK